MFDLGTPLTRFGPYEFSLADAFEGVLITGTTGSGKSSTSGAALARAFLNAGMGGLVLTAKADETANWRRYAAETGRSDDLIIFSADSGHAFDAIRFEWHACGKNVESLVDVFSTILAIGKKHADTSADRFWDNAVEHRIRVGLVLLDLAGETVNIRQLDRLFQSLPKSPGEYETPEWQATSYCAGLFRLVRARKDSLSLDQWNDLEYATFETCINWAAMDQRTRSNIDATWAGLASKLQFNPLARVVNDGACTFVPEMTTHQGKIIICDFPVLKWNETGRLINCLMKLIFQRAWLRRDLEECDRPVFLMIDEAPFFILPKGHDSRFQAVCRQSRIAVACLAQNLLQIAEALGEHELGPATKGWLANLVTKICHTQSCFDTNTYIANLIGKEWRNLKSAQYGMGGGVSMGRQEHLMYRVEPDALTRLKKPNSTNPVAECLIYQGGRLFGDQPYIVTSFSR